MDITLALGGGGARGASHLGVLRVLNREGFRVRAVAGTSIGAMVGAFFASGRSADDIEHLFASVDVSRLYGWPLSDGPGLLGVRRIAEWLHAHLGDVTFDELPMPFAAIAVDLNTRREIILREGRVVDAILGSIAVPGVFPPRQLNGMTLVDGGALDPVPVRPARAMMPALPVVAVSLLAPLEKPDTMFSMPSLPLPPPLLDTLTRLSITQTFKIFSDSIDIGQRQMTSLRLELDKPEVLITPDVGHIQLLDKIDVHALAKLGETAAQEKLDDLRRAVSLPARAWRWMNAGVKVER